MCLGSLSLITRNHADLPSVGPRVNPSLGQTERSITDLFNGKYRDSQTLLTFNKDFRTHLEYTGECYSEQEDVDQSIVSPEYLVLTSIVLFNNLSISSPVPF